MACADVALRVEVVPAPARPQRDLRIVAHSTHGDIHVPQALLDRAVEVVVNSVHGTVYLGGSR